MIARTLFGQLLWLGITLSPFMLVILALAVIPSALQPPWVFGLAVFAAFGSSRYVHLAVIRHTRQRVLQTIIREMAIQEKKPFVLISRSYRQSTEFRTFAAFTGASDEVTLFEALIYDLSFQHPVVVLGDQDLDPNDPAARALFMSPWPAGKEIEGIGKGWEDIFVSMATSARFILLVPANSEGVLREIALLRQHNLGTKTVVYMWPSKQMHPLKSISASSDAWEALRNPLAEAGLHLPPHQSHGALLRLNRDLSIRSTYAPIHGRNILSAVVADDERWQLTPLCEVAPMIRDYELAANMSRYWQMWMWTYSAKRAHD